MSTHQKFLEFNGKNILFKNENGVYWVAIKPICEALNVVYTGQLKRLKKHHFLGSALYKCTMQVPNDQPRAMTCISERYVYGWIMSINSEKEELIKFQKTCYDLLYDHFHGTITGRKNLLIKRNKIDEDIAKLKEELKQEDVKYKALRELETQRKKLSAQLNKIDKEVINQIKIPFS